MKKKLLLCFTAFCSMSGNSQTPNDSTDIVLQDSARWEKLLEGVSVTAQRQLIKQEIDRVGYDVQADEESKTENVLEMLRKVPMVTVDAQENILVKGNNSYKIYKNGHYDPSLSRNAKDILRAMPASAVKRIEVITDPGAREDAEGVNAILNIVMMDNRMMDGVTGTVTVGYTSLEHKNLSAYLAAQFGKLIVSLDYGYGGMSKKETRNNGFIHRQYVETGNFSEINSEGTNKGHIHFADLNASYEIDTLNLLSASFGGYFYKLDVDGGANTAMYDKLNNQLYAFRENYWLPGYGHHSWSGRFDYEHKTHLKDEKLTLSYMLALTRQHNDQETNYTDFVNVPFEYTGFLQNSRERFTEHTFQLDYMRPLWMGHKIEMGAKYIDRMNYSDNKQTFYHEIQSPPTTAELEHTTKVAAAYIDYMYNKDKWSARAGMRYEYSFLQGKYPDGKGQSFDKHLSDWVPQASLKYQIDDRQSLKLGYNTSISRPGITYLNPAVVTTPTRVDFGNAHLKSAHDQTIQLTYMYVGQRLTLQVAPMFSFYNHELGSIVYAENDIRYSTWGNVLNQHRFQLDGYLQWKPFDNTTIMADVMLTDNHAKNTSVSLKQHLTNVFCYTKISQKLPWKIMASAYLYGQIGHSPQNIYAYDYPWQRYGFSLQRSFLSDDRLTVRLAAHTPFKKYYHFKTKTTQGDIIGWGDAVNAAEGRMFQINVSFRFGKLKSTVKKAETTIDNSDLKGGISRGNN